MKLLKSETTLRELEYHYRGKRKKEKKSGEKNLRPRDTRNLSQLYPTDRTFPEYRPRDESTRNDGGSVARFRAHDAGRHEDVEGACYFQP